jgi:hypothetical protein
MHTAIAAQSTAVGRRSALAGLVGTPALLTGLPQDAKAAYGSGSSYGSGGAADSGPLEFFRFYGAADPPATYGGVGGCKPELARYSYDMVKGKSWHEEPVGKVDKAIAGIDSLWVGPGKRKAFCVTLNRAGEDGKEFIASTPEQTIRSVAGAQPDLQDALAFGELSYDKKMINGVEVQDFEIGETNNHFLVRILFLEGRLFSFFVTAPEKSFQADADNLRRIFFSFEAYDNGKFLLDDQVDSERVKKVIKA